ncbi:AI-2E family transporter [Marinimicrococcus flavescens]|uniref:AI-2E family transporter n=1 Tax=Marinimicrococcus flavescens TaxID=3031815 RepID=A0AAP3UYB3_9PROT|nr:AI-2E family transporter [Marinimicrococcus flavescens]
MKNGRPEPLRIWVDDRVELAIGIAAIAVLVVGCFLVLRPFLGALLWGVILAYSTWPICRRLTEMLGGRRSLAALLMTLLLAAAFVLPIVLVGTSAADGVVRLSEIVRQLFAFGPPIPPAWLDGIPVVGGFLHTLWLELVTNTRGLAEVLQPYLAAIRDFAITLAVGVGGGLLEMTFSVIATFFFYRDGEAFIRRAREVGERIVGERTQHLLDVAGKTVLGVVYGIVGTAIVQALLATIGYAITGLNGALALGFLTFFLALVPMGPPLVWIPVSIWLFTEDRWGMALFMALWGTFAISGVDNVVRPWLISRGSSMSFLMVFLGVVGGALAFGFLGLFLGPVLLALGTAVLGYWISAEDGSSTPPPEGGIPAN